MSRTTVTRTSSSRWVGEHHRKTIFVIGGAVDGAAVPSLRARAESEAREGSTRVVLDIRGIVSCDRAGLLGLARLRGRLDAHPECVVDVVGARWPQFADILAREAAEGTETLRGTVRELRRPLMIDPHRVPVVAPAVPAPRSMPPTEMRPADS
ncbi:STAS domain-containing protein [Actinomycetospora sp. NBC_00405]|uniref:STAS domain-containing protein n=1 Tax=Actinomycetospora sp. NBC_00405 TaxID=2975952 RepID=UPI002E23FE5C